VVFVGPVSPAYPEVCCDAFTTSPDPVCRETAENVVGKITDVGNVKTCQLFCQVYRLKGTVPIDLGQDEPKEQYFRPKLMFANPFFI
jgi:hypothetical protein